MYAGERRAPWPSQALVVDLGDCTSDEHPLVGGKATGLGALIRNGFRVPPGFALTTRAYREHVEHNALADDIERLVAECRTYEAQQHAADEEREQPRTGMTERADLVVERPDAEDERDRDEEQTSREVLVVHRSQRRRELRRPESRRASRRIG